MTVLLIAVCVQLIGARKIRVSLCQKVLTYLEVNFYFIFIGIGCIFPFLPLHMLSVGLDKGEARLISAVAPCIALLGPAVLGPLIDK